MNTPVTEPITPTEPQADDPAPAEPAAEPAAHVDLTVESLALPEGFVLDETIAPEFISVANELKLSPEQANKLIELHAKTQQQALEADSSAWDATQKEWKDAVQNDPDIGGVKLQPALTNIGKLIDEYGSKEFREIMDLTGAGNNVHFVKFLAKIADKLTEPGPTQGSPKPHGDLTAAQRLFPSMKG